jgi:hypothetical protein
MIRRPRARALSSPDAALTRTSWRPVPFVLLGAVLWSAARTPSVPAAPANRASALVEVLRTRGLDASPNDVTWLDGPSGFEGATVGEARALVRANVKDEPADLYVATTRLSPEGVLLDVLGVYDITRTSGVDEGRPVVSGDRAAYETSLGDTVTAIHTLDLRGASAATYADFNRIQRWQTELTNLQQTGQPDGVLHDAFALDPAAQHADVAWAPNGLLDVSADGRTIRIDAARGVAVEGGGWVRAIPAERARPGNLITWSVDRVRAMPWFGDTRMQWLKAIVFTTLDLVLRLKSHVVDTSAADVAIDLGVTMKASDVVAVSDPEIGWPPPPLTPILTPAIPGEGRWILLDHDPFITPGPGLPSAFVTTFIRTDRERADTRVYVTLWDPRLIALHMVAGTVEPVSASGEAGPGLIPRVPEVMRRLVAGFNGGFQAIHGEYGMQADGVEYLPPKPYAATVLELRDGSTGFGAWPASAAVPEEVLGFRQNLTALVEHEKWNPWGRTWWGGTPPGWEDNIHTTRTGLCLTQDRAIGYFFGAGLSAEALGRAMIQAHCDFGIHLDMNPGLAGFEFYDVEPTEDVRPLARPLQTDWEYEGTIHDLPDLHVRARRMTRGMMEVNFPQYIHREARDFFYLTRRALLPGRDIAPIVTPAEAGEGAWRVKGLPQQGFPYAMATTDLRPDPREPGRKVHVLRLDPKTLRPAGSAGTTEQTPTVVSLFSDARGPLSVWWQDEMFMIGASVPLGAAKVASGVPFGVARAPLVRAVAGVEDLDGMLDWIEVDGGGAPSQGLLESLDGVLARLGCSRRVAIEGDARALLGGSTDLAGAPSAPPLLPFVRFVRGTTPAAHPYFETTPIVGPSVWQPLQSKRVRYFPKPPKPAPPAPASAAPSTAAASSAALPEKAEPTPHRASVGGEGPSERRDDGR